MSEQLKNMTEDLSPGNDSIFYTVKDPGGSPLDRKVTLQTVLSGNAATATALQSARTIAGVSFDGTANISIASTDLSDTANIVRLDASNTFTNSINSFTSASSSRPLVQLTNTNEDAAGALFRLIKDSASPADNDELGEILFLGNDSGAASTTFARISGYSSDVTDTDESGKINFSVMMDGTDRDVVTINGYNGSVNQGEVVINEEGQDINFRVESVGQANALFVQGSDGAVGAGTNAPVYDFDLARSAKSAKFAACTYSSNIAHYPFVQLKRSASNSIGTDVVTVNATFLGVVNFLGVNSSNAAVSGANIYARQTAAAGADYIATELVLQTSSGAASPAQRLVIESNGTLNVAGTTNYEDLVTSDDDIPNKKYCDDLFAPKLFTPINQAATDTLTAAEVSSTVINNYGQTVANTQTLPTAAAGYNGMVVIGTAGAGAFHLKAGPSDKIYLDGTALDDGDKVSLATPAVGDYFTFWTFQTGASAYDYIVTTGAGTLTDGGA